MNTDKPTIAICEQPPDCDHEWVFPDWLPPDSEANDSGWPQEVCGKCGMSMIRHIFTECP